MRSHEMISPDPLPKGVKTIPSAGISLIEGNLSVVYDFPPNEVEMSYHNRLTLFSKEDRFRAAFGLAFLIGNPRLLDRIGLHVPAGFYAPEWHTIFVWPKARYPNPDVHEQTYIHELGHGYYYQKSPALWRAAVSSMEEHPKVSDPNDVDKKLIEEFIVHAFAAEGFASWVSKEAIKRNYYQFAREGGFDKQRGVEYRNGVIRAKIEETLKYPYLEVEMPNVMRAIDLYADALRYAGSDRFKRVRRVTRVLGNFAYVRGLYFTDLVMDHLIGSGLSVSEALDVFIENAPTSFDQIRDIKKFTDGMK